MRILSRYFLRLYLPVFALCLGIFGCVIFMNYFIRLFHIAVLKGISLWWILACFARLSPYVMSLCVPMAFLVALLLTLGKLSESGEVMALRASGFSYREMTRPFLVLGVLLSGALFLINHKVSPEGFHSFKLQQTYAAQKIARLEVAAGTFMKVGPWRLFAETADPATGRMEGVYLIKPGVEQGARVSAPRGQLTLQKGQGVHLEFSDGDLQLANRTPSKFTTARFKRYRIFVPLGGAARGDRRPDMQELNSPDLWERIHDPATGAQHRTEYKVEMAVRSAGALSPFVFFWIGAPLALRLGRNSRGVGFALSMGILFAFYGLLFFGIGLGRRDENVADFAPFLADGAGLIAGAFLTRRAASL